MGAEINTSMRYSEIFEADGNLVVYHGTIGNAEPHNGMFFSTDQSFAKDYGTVYIYRISLGRCFNSLDSIDVEPFLPLHDSYDGVDISTMEEYMTRSSDTWEMLEPVARFINKSGFDAMEIYEGGVLNYYVFDRRRISLIGKYL